MRRVFRVGRKGARVPAIRPNWMGIFFAALSIRSRNRELLLSLILFPIFIPALLAMVQATTSILTGESDPTLWIKLLLGYDIIFTTASLMLFDVVFHAE